MEIRAIYYINLDRRRDRNAFFRKHLEELKTDMSIVHRVSGHDGAAHPDIFKMSEAAVTDGFPQLKDACDVGLGTFGCLWSYRTVLRRIRDSASISMMFVDDCYIKEPISVFNALLSAIPPEDFRVTWRQMKIYIPTTSHNIM